MKVGTASSSMYSAALCRNDRLAYPRATISGTSYAQVIGETTPASASFSSQIST